VAAPFRGLPGPTRRGRTDADLGAGASALEIEYVATDHDAFATAGVARAHGGDVAEAPPPRIQAEGKTTNAVVPLGTEKRRTAVRPLAIRSLARPEHRGGPSDGQPTITVGPASERVSMKAETGTATPAPVREIRSHARSA
jgi:hypothetical protein